MFTEPNFPYTTLVHVDVVDVNDWIPNFELDSYHFKVNANAKVGAAIGQIMAYDQDKTASFLEDLFLLRFVESF